MSKRALLADQTLSEVIDQAIDKEHKGSRIVYIRPATDNEILELVEEEDIEGIPTDVYLVYSQAGEKLAAVKGLALAVAAVKQQNLEPFLVH